MGSRSLLASALALVTAGVYAQTLGFDFVDWDDPAYVTENPAAQAGLTWQGVAWAWTTWHAGNWHPLTWVSHMVDRSLFGAWPGGHHLTSVLLHVANALLVYRFFERTHCSIS